MEQVVQVLASLLILTAFVGVQRGRIVPDSRHYLTLNVSGSAVLAVLAVVERQWGFALLEVVWAAVSGYGLLATVGGGRAGGR